MGKTLINLLDTMLLKNLHEETLRLRKEEEQDRKAQEAETRSGTEAEAEIELRPTIQEEGEIPVLEELLESSSSSWISSFSLSSWKSSFSSVLPESEELVEEAEPETEELVEEVEPEIEEVEE